MYVTCLLSFFPSPVIMENFLKDADQIKKTFLLLLGNQPAAAAWMSRVLDSVVLLIREVRVMQLSVLSTLGFPFKISVKALKTILL